jgi:Family of unknown function (DUF6496)
MPEQKTLEEARELKREGKSSKTQAGPFVHEEIEHVRSGKHGVRNIKQAIAIGLSKARKAGIDLPPPPKGRASEKTRRSAARAHAQGQRGHPHKPSLTRSRAVTGALKRESRGTASSQALSHQAKQAARHRTAAERSASARKGMRKRSPKERSAAARKQPGPGRGRAHK